MHAKASLAGTTLAETSSFEFVEGNVYFPASAVVDKATTLTPSADGHTTWCPWKGTAHYYDVHAADGKVVKNGAWYYPEPLEKAVHIRDAVAFYKSKIEVEKE